MITLNKKFAVIAVGIILLSVVSVIFYQIIANIAGTVSKSAEISTPTDAIRKSIDQGNEDAAAKSAEDVITRESDSAKTEDAYWKLASIYEKKQDLLKLKDVYQKIVEKFPSSSKILRAQEALENTNVKLLFSHIVTPDSFVYEVQKGDGLAKIAKKFNTTVDLISRANDLMPDVLRYGKKLKITKLKFSIVVDKSQNILTLKADGNVLKTYRVATGKDSSTPVGTFKIITKIVNPPWYPPKGKVIPSGDPKNVLGSRWLGISKPSYGIHGTIDPLSIGKSVTEGCIRMKNAEVEELYSIVPEGTEVVIVD